MLKLFVAFVVSLVSLSCASDAPSSSGPPVVVTAAALWTAYDANEVAADELYKGKRLQVTGKLKSIDKDLMGDVVLMLEAPNEFSTVHAGLDDADEGKAAKLTKGSEITVTCEGGGMVIGSPILRDCRLP
jgi:hypothetical protein